MDENILRRLRDKYAPRRAVIRGEIPNPITPDYNYPLDKLTAIDDDTLNEEDARENRESFFENRLIVRTYNDGRTFRVVDRYGKCPRNSFAINAHVQSMQRQNFCGLCNQALSEW